MEEVELVPINEVENTDGLRVKNFDVRVAKRHPHVVISLTSLDVRHEQEQQHVLALSLPLAWGLAKSIRRTVRTYLCR